MRDFNQDEDKTISDKIRSAVDIIQKETGYKLNYEAEAIVRYLVLQNDLNLDAIILLLNFAKRQDALKG